MKSQWSQEHYNWLDWQCVNFQFEVLVWVDSCLGEFEQVISVVAVRIV